MEWVIEQQQLEQSHLSLQDIAIPVKVLNAGVSYNPTADVLKFAFMPTAVQVPGSSDWVTGSWVTIASDIIYPYRAQCLVGPGGTINPGIGTYVVYIDITDSPEIPVEIAGTLQIT